MWDGKGRGGGSYFGDWDTAEGSECYESDVDAEGEGGEGFGAGDDGGVVYGVGFWEEEEG